MAARGRLQKNFVGAKTYVDDFFKVLLKFKMAATDQLHFYGGLNKLIWSIFLILTSHS